MATALLPDALWDLVEPFMPIPPRRPQGGRPRVSDRACLTGIVFILRSGIPWHMLPQELGCGSGMTCWRRLRDWQQAGVWDLIHFALFPWVVASTPLLSGPRGQALGIGRYSAVSGVIRPRWIQTFRSLDVC
jgi:transposase